MSGHWHTARKVLGQAGVKIERYTGEPREKPQGGGVFIWASLRNFQIKSAPQDLNFQYFGF